MAAGRPRSAEEGGRDRERASVSRTDPVASPDQRTKETGPVDGLVDDLTARTDGTAPAPATPPPPRGGGTPRRYAASTDAPVRYLPVVRAGVLLGCLWAAEAEDAAGFVARDAAGGPAERFWAERIARCAHDGLRPLKVLHRWAGEVEDPVGGAVPAEARERIAASPDVLRALLRPR